MKIIFLDIDGVLVTWRSLSRWGKGHSPHMFQIKCVNLLNSIIKKTNSKIVVSSSWRIGRNMQQLKEDLTPGGLDCSVIIDITPRLHNMQRGHEIKHWLDNNTTKHNIQKFCVIDDDSDMDTVRENFVQTSMKTGLTLEHKERILELLN